MPDAAPETSRANANLTLDVPRYSHYALIVLTTVNLLNYVDRQVLPSVASYMIKDVHLQLTDAEIGYMESALLLSFTVFAPLFGRLGDRYPRAKIMATAAVIWSFATALTGVADHLAYLPGLNFHIPIVGWGVVMSGVALTLCFVRALVGIGESAYSTITPSLIADYYPPRRRATALGIFQAAIPLGFSLGFVLGAFATWVALFLERDKGMSEKSAPVTLGIIALCAGALGTFGGGWIADRIARGRSSTYFMLCSVSTFLSIGPMLVALVAHDARVYLPAIFLAVTLLFVNNAPFHAILLQSVPTRVRAMAVALNIVVIHTFGDAI